MNKNEKVKKPFYKNKWFIAFMALIVIGTIGIAMEEPEEGNIQNSETVDQEENGPDYQTETVTNKDTIQEKSINVEWDKVIEETKKEVMNPEFFSYVKDTHIEVSEEDKIITFTAVLGDSTDKEVAVEFADTFVRKFSSNIAIKNSNLESPGHEYLGEVFDHYSIRIGVTPLSKTDNQNEWFVDDAIARGVHRNPKGNN